MAEERRVKQKEQVNHEGKELRKVQILINENIRNKKV